jgi:hypothetical protein
MSTQSNLPVSANGNQENTIDSFVLTRKRAKSLVPSNPLEMVQVGREVMKHWPESKIDIQWTNPAIFEPQLDTLEISCTKRTQADTKRNPITRRMKELDEIINSNLRYPKDYIAEYYSDSPTPAEEYYRDFGIEYNTNGSYRFPTAKERRVEALKVMIAAMSTHGMTERKFGVQFWQPIFEEYSQLLANSFSSDSGKKVSIVEKEEVKRAVYKTLKAVTLMLQAVFPDNYMEMYRIWGFHREKY